MLNQSVVNMYNNEEDFRNLTPSRTPQSFDQPNSEASESKMHNFMIT